jgi:hypothetical protein
MGAAGQHDPLDAQAAGGLQDVVGADHVDVQDALEAVLVGNAGQMDDRVDVGGGLDHGSQVADIGADELFALLGGSQGRDVEQAQRWEAAAESVAQDRAHRAGGARDEDSMHPWFP